MDFLKNFPIIIVGFALMILLSSIVAIQLKIYSLLYPLSIITPIGTFIIISIFLIKLYKEGKKESKNE